MAAAAALRLLKRENQVKTTPKTQGIVGRKSCDLTLGSAVHGADTPAVTRAPIISHKALTHPQPQDGTHLVSVLFHELGGGDKLLLRTSFPPSLLLLQTS
ncbi:hypothetical protein EYF80_047011 [Liparis tanakae]|uniref:Uncharacterized protein n=1 Tax=Liparis tanakae TaxID=230148 RepID=A0A4Z2FP46_9TELE|nr:hypothetical protein EYF80_047011 [Liparis tanakae]